MTWITKDLTLDLLAIGIDAMQRTFNRIKEEPGEWPPALDKKPTATPGAAPDEEAPAPQPDTPPAAAPQQEASAPSPDPQALLTEAKTLLQTISSNGGTAWIKGTLLPQFGVQKLSDVPAEKLPELIKIAKQKQQEAA